ncbi:MAG: transcription termination/antitermination protein NusA [Clostridia bacterium]|nr:transcription termination/antitermination protein NusA [Clostridia bacterium]
MNSEFFEALDLIEREKGISKEYMLEKVEAALISAYKRDKNGNSNVRVAIDSVKKTVKMFQQLEIVEAVEDPDTQITEAAAQEINKRYKLGGICEVEIKTKNLRRLAALTAKQVIVQGIREAERANIVKEYESKREEIVTATVIKVDELSGNVVLDTGTSNATLLKSEQIPGETFEVGDRVKVYITEVSRETHGHIVTLSRKHPGLVKRMFELEIPEIADGTVLVKAIAREAGSRTKIAVESRDENVDPIGACIGNRGARIAMIIDELRGEKIDIVRYSEDAAEFIREALSPAEVCSVELDSERSARVVVYPDQLSLAIGKEGQNARLAARLTGFRIDIKA